MYKLFKEKIMLIKKILFIGWEFALWMIRLNLLLNNLL